MAEVKLKGADSLVRLMRKPDLWVPPANAANYLGFVLKVLTSSRYKDLFMRLAPEDLHSVLKIRVQRCFWEGTLDLEEIVDLGAYATLLYLRTSTELVDPKVAAKEMIGQLRNMSCGVVTFKQELDKGLKEKVESNEMSPAPAASSLVGGMMQLPIDYEDEVKRLRAENEELERAKAEQTPTKTKNDNCLLDMKCPKCGSLEPFDILVTCWTKIFDDGTGRTNNHVWDNGSGCNCSKCNYQGKVSDFRSKKLKPLDKVGKPKLVLSALLPSDGIRSFKKPKKKRGTKWHTSKRTSSSARKS